MTIASTSPRARPGPIISVGKFIAFSAMGTLGTLQWELEQRAHMGRYTRIGKSTEHVTILIMSYWYIQKTTCALAIQYRIQNLWIIIM